MKVPNPAGAARAVTSGAVGLGRAGAERTLKATVRLLPIPVHGVYASPPPVPLSLTRAALTPRPAAARRAIPGLEARLQAYAIDPRTLARYREVMGSSADVPLAFPQLIATQLHIALIGSPKFPFPAMGLVHPRFGIVQHRRIRPDEPLDVRAWIEGRRETRSGIEFDLRAQVDVAGETVWESTAATLVRRKKKGGGQAGAGQKGGGQGGSASTGSTSVPAPGSAPGTVTEPLLETPAEPLYTDSADFDAPANAGRRYAAVSGDFNPIHLHPRTSSLLGYRRPIAHGWWLLGRCLAELGLDAPENAARVEIEFRRPTMLPATLSLLSGSADGGTVFALRDAKGKDKLTGRVTAVG